MVFDTNLLSELMRSRPDVRVLRWVERGDPAVFFTTSITRAEILSGIAMLPEGQRRSMLTAAATGMFVRSFVDRVLPFDGMAADHYATITVNRRRQGRPIKPLDAMISAIARAHGAGVATRDIGDFADCGIAVQNPWQDG